MSASGRIGVYPGSFNPPTTAHVAIATAAVRQHGLDRVDLAFSRRVLGKDEVERPTWDDRVEVVEAVAAEHEWLGAVVATELLLADIAAGYDVVIMGADKWNQIHELQWYADATERDAAIARLPTVVVAPRPPLAVPPDHALAIDTAIVADVSSTDARNGRLDLMAPAARAFAERTGAWIDPPRYERWLSGG